MPSPDLSLYSMTKASVMMVTKNAAKEFGPLGVRVNAISPGWVETGMTSYRFKDEAGEVDPAKREQVLKQMSMGSPIRPYQSQWVALRNAAELCYYETTAQATGGSWNLKYAQNVYGVDLFEIRAAN